MYTCCSCFSCLISFIAVAPPEVLISQQSRKVSVGSNITLSCSGRGNPQPAITWSRKDNGHLPRFVVVWCTVYSVNNDKLLRLNVDIRCLFCLCCRHHTTGDNWININPVHSDDYGEYLCTAKNELGVSEGVVVLEPSGCCFNFSAIIIFLSVSQHIRQFQIARKFQITLRPNFRYSKSNEFYIIQKLRDEYSLMCFSYCAKQILKS